MFKPEVNVSDVQTQLFIKAFESEIIQNELSPTTNEIRLALKYLWFTNGQRVVWRISRMDLAVRILKSYKQIRTSMKELQQKGFVEVLEDNRGKTLNYKLLPKLTGEHLSSPPPKNSGENPTFDIMSPSLEEAKVSIKTHFENLKRLCQTIAFSTAWKIASKSRKVYYERGNTQSRLLFEGHNTSDEVVAVFTSADRKLATERVDNIHPYLEGALQNRISERTKSRPTTSTKQTTAATELSEKRQELYHAWSALMENLNTHRVVAFGPDFPDQNIFEDWKSSRLNRLRMDPAGSSGWIGDDTFTFWFDEIVWRPMAGSVRQFNDYQAHIAAVVHKQAEESLVENKT